MRRIVSLTTATIGTLILLATLSACGSSIKQTANHSDPTNQRLEATVIQAVDGTSVAFGDFGGQPTVLWFWTPH